jgi:hypothetical protein
MSKQLSKLTVYKKADTVLAVATAFAFDVDDIITPITLNASSKAVFGYQSKYKGAGYIEYHVNETLSYIRDTSEKFVLLTVTAINDVAENSVSTVFNQSRIVDAIETVSGGCEFYYKEGQDGLNSVKYKVSQTIDQVIAAGNEILQKTGTVVNFVRDAFYGTIASPESGNITQDLTGAKLGTTIVIIHDAAGEPTYPATWQKLADSGNYDNAAVNYISATYVDATHIKYTITQDL